MGVNRSCPTRNLALLAIAVTLLVTPLAYSATGNAKPAAVGPIAAHAGLGQRAGQARAAHLLRPSPARSGGEPISSVGHGGFFDGNGRQIVPTFEFVSKAQSWYRGRLVSGLNAKKLAELSAFEQRLAKGLNPVGQAKLVLQQRSLDWLVVNSPRMAAEGRMRMKLNALKYRLSWRLPRRDDHKQLQNLVPFKLDSRIEARLKRPEFSPIDKLITTNSGAAYEAECMANGVPIPPSIGVMDPLGLAGWRSLGFIPQLEQFIEGTPAEVRVFESPNGMCIALPRYVDGTLADVKLDGIICLSQTTSKVCFWDNQMGGSGFNFPAGTQIPIGAPDLMVNASGWYQAGGAELEFGSGGVCTDCHAGENPYIIHPSSDLGGGLLMGDLDDPPLSLPTFAPNRYDPIVPASWPQNQLSQTDPYVPGACVGCHTLGGSGGRFPHLSPALPGYCGAVLNNAILSTMPLGFGLPGTLAGTMPITDFQAWCGVPATSGPSDRGDPHLTTTNGINYDFQAAGEFRTLKNSSTGFELQTRQTPVTTTFMPGPNAWTGLASCVSLNTAAALRVGSHRVSYQPSPSTPGKPEQMELRIDGKLTALPTNGSLNLGGNNRIARAAAGGGIDVRVDDGTRVIITPNYWSSQGYWYLDVEVLNTPAREGTMGHIPNGNWLPLRPNGSSFGPAPGGLAARHTLLNATFANAWRVSSTTSLFDYASGTSTATFTNPNWPPPPGTSCTTIPGGGSTREPVRPLDAETARRVCSPIQDQRVFDNCVFDVIVTGNAAMANGYITTLQLRNTP
ncbi:MAG TPA: hypothetical protein VKK31_25700 [Thermoanaerobaculia bacterium]|nr:hypothetical protein [Thermoanaerobaculia bacterium]